MNKNIPNRRFKEYINSPEWKHELLGRLGNFYSNGVDKITRPNQQKVHMINYMDIYKRIEINNLTKNSLMVTTANPNQLINNNVLKGDIFLTPTSETADDIGRSMVITEDLDNVVYSYHLMRFRPFENVFDILFPNFLFETEKVRNQFSLKAQGVQRFVLNKSQFEETIITIPSIPEQNKIGLFFEKLDNMIKIQSNKIKKYELLKESYLEKMLPEKSQNVPELRFKNFNYEWEKLVFKEQFKVSQGLQIPINERYTTSGIGKYFYITIEFLKDNNMKKYYIKEPNKTVVSNMTDILMVRTGNVGVVLTDIIGCFHNNFFKVDYNRKEFYQYYLYHKFTSPKFQRKLLANSGSSTIPDLSHTSFYSIEEFFPMFEEQKKMGDFFQKIDNIIELQNEKLDKLKNLKQAYLNEMFVN